MNARAISLTIVAFLLGALAAGGIGVRVIREVRTDPDATSLPQANIAPEAKRPSLYQVDPNETLMASTALVPVSLDIEGESMQIRYDLVSVAPQLGSGTDGGVGGDGAVVHPGSWTVRTTSGSVVEASVDAGSRSVVFDVGPDFTVDDIVSVAVTEASAPYPIDIPFTLSMSSSVVGIGFGVTAELVDVVTEGSETIARITITSDSRSSDTLFVSAVDPRWSAVALDGSADESVNIRWSDGRPPGDIDLRAVGSVVVPIRGEFDVFLDGLS